MGVVLRKGRLVMDMKTLSNLVRTGKGGGVVYWIKAGEWKRGDIP